MPQILPPICHTFPANSSSLGQLNLFQTGVPTNRRKSTAASRRGKKGRVSVIASTVANDTLQASQDAAPSTLVEGELAGSNITSKEDEVNLVPTDHNTDSNTGCKQADEQRAVVGATDSTSENSLLVGGWKTLSNTPLDVLIEGLRKLESPINIATVPHVYDIVFDNLDAPLPVYGNFIRKPLYYHVGIEHAWSKFTPSAWVGMAYLITAVPGNVRGRARIRDCGIHWTLRSACRDVAVSMGCASARGQPIGGLPEGQLDPAIRNAFVSCRTIERANHILAIILLKCMDIANDIKLRLRDTSPIGPLDYGMKAW
ncbi:hypothetical protein OBBRIDRAFT_803153 [Obba rivulosa]|uniref:Uncharacterized protein n=1 Tax=Obba rivulosa TaxID=1052685 RepID=A0A8E2AV98_9APHY|nr:hypothetical protein OBBRIDRAFT_803153 [Obba rivulosa]